MACFESRLEATAGNVAILRQLNSTGEIALDHYFEKDGAWVLGLTEAEIATLEAHGVEVERTASLEDLAEERKAGRAAPLQPDLLPDTLATGFVNAYMDATEVVGRIQSLATEFPSLCHLTILPYASTGYDGSVSALTGPAQVQLLRITDDPSDRRRPALLLICGTHAREWINPLIAVEFTEQLVRNYDPTSTEPDIVGINRIIEEGEVLIVPVMNPDGLNFSIHDEAGWRKNRRLNPGSPGCPGVDNNRNYEVYFGDPGSSALECSQTHHGPAPFSERENRNIRHILEEFPNILIGVDSHSFGEKIFRPTAGGGIAIASLPVFPEDEVIYLQLEAVALAAIQGVNGKTYVTGTTSNHAGTSDEHMFFAHRIFGFDFECALSFQPPIASALVSVQEVTAALRALALEAVDLKVETVDPVRVVQCIDRTGSMITLGYESAARGNARRFVDLMSIGDSVAVVSFADPSPDPTATPLADRAIIEFPLTVIDEPGDFGDARASIGGIAFGGWTSIGAGLQKSASELASVSSARAVVLLSDGFENREPWAADVLSAWPSDLPIYSIALGGLADISLLQNLAVQTGGQFYLSPTSLDLHEIYNQIRMDVTPDELVLNSVVTEEQESGSAEYSAFVEYGASRLTISLSWEGLARKADIVIFDPRGRRRTHRDWGVQRIRGEGYILLRLQRPIPGRWTICTPGAPAQYSLAAFIRSPLRLIVRTVPATKRARRTRSVLVGASLPDGQVASLSGTLSLSGPWPTITYPVPGNKRDQLQWTDVPFVGIRSSAEGTRRLTLEKGGCFAALCPTSSTQREKTELSNEFRFNRRLRPGLYTARSRIEGTFGGGFRFERVALTTVFGG